MKQPELGLKIALLRKARGLTQDDLCQACNLNIRTLQRIERGEVNPRIYTLKLISEKLDFDLWSGVIQQQADEQKSWWDRNFLSSPSRKTMAAHAKWGWIGGILYFILIIPDVFMGIWRYTGGSMTPGFQWLYIMISVLMIFASVLFFRGFASLGRKLNQSILTISAYLLLLLTIAIYGYDLLTLSFDHYADGVPVFHLLTFGFSGIFFGVGLSRIESTVGSAAKIAAILEIISGICFILVITAIIGLITILPAIIAEIILLYKVYDIYREPSPQLNWTSA